MTAENTISVPNYLRDLAVDIEQGRQPGNAAFIVLVNDVGKMSTIGLNIDNMEAMFFLRLAEEQIVRRVVNSHPVAGPVANQENLN